MKLISPAFEHEGQIPRKYTCHGEGMSPPLRIEGVPTEAQSLVLMMEDPDVPTSIRPDGMWDHWLVWNIDPKTTELPEGTEPAGVHGLTTSQTTTYVGPCPPDREHRYVFKLYAIDGTIDLPVGARKGELLKVMDGHIINQTELVGRYQKS